MLTDFQIRDTFVNKDSLHNTLFTYKAKIENETTLCKNIFEKKKVVASYKQKIFVKLHTIFRRQIILDREEAIAFYGRNLDILNDRIELLYDTLNFINEELDVDFVPDRLLLCAYFRIDAETYDVLLNDVRADITESVRLAFKSIEELMLSLTTNAIENGLVNQSAWKRLSLKSKFGGSEVQTVNDKIGKGGETILITSSEEIEKRLGTSYNFKELENLEDNKEG